MGMGDIASYRDAATPTIINVWNEHSYLEAANQFFTHVFIDEYLDWDRDELAIGGPGFFKLRFVMAVVFTGTKSRFAP